MALEINNESVRDLAILRIENNLTNAYNATNGAIVADESIMKGDFISTIVFDAIGDASRRDPTSTAEMTAKSLSDTSKTNVKLYFADLVAYTYTELARAGADDDEVTVNLGEAIGDGVTRWILERTLISTVAAIGSTEALVHTTDTAGINIKDINKGFFKFGDKSEKIVTIVASSIVVADLVDGALDSTADQISYGATYKSNIGTLGRALWQVDADALVDAGKNMVIGLVKGAVVISESELIQIWMDDDITKVNTKKNIKTEGAYTLDIKGFTYDQSQGINPEDAVLGATASWSLVGDRKNSAGVLIKEGA